MQRSTNDAKGMLLQPRDISLLRALLATRITTTGEASETFFHGSKEATRKRLARLREAGLISKKSGELAGASSISITPAGITALRAGRPGSERRERPKHRGRGASAHEAEVMEVEEAFTSAGAPWRCDFRAWPGGAVAPSFSVGGAMVCPDAFVRIYNSDTSGISGGSFFIEVDRSTERLETLAAKAEAYRAFLGTGGFARLCGHPLSSRRRHPFRVLVVVPSEERRNNVAERLLRCRPPILRLVWLSTLEEVRRDPLGAIWVRPADYREAVRGTPYADATAPRRGYRTRPERERLVADRVTKQRLLQ